MMKGKVIIMRKIISVLAISAVLLTAVGCTSSENKNDASGNNTDTPSSTAETVDVLAQLPSFTTTDELIAKSDVIVKATVVSVSQGAQDGASSEENKDAAISTASANEQGVTYTLESEMNFIGAPAMEFEVVIYDENVQLKSAESYVLFLSGSESPYELVSAYYAEADKNGAYQPIEGITAPTITLDSLINPSVTTAATTTTTMK